MNITHNSRSSSPRDTSPTFVDLGGVNFVPSHPINVPRRRRSSRENYVFPSPPLSPRSLSTSPTEQRPSALPPPKFFERVIGARVHLGPIGTGSAVWRLRVAAAEEQATDTEDESTESEPSCDSPVRPKATRF